VQTSWACRSSTSRRRENRVGIRWSTSGRIVMKGLGTGVAITINGRLTLNGDNMGLYRIRPWWAATRRTWDPWRDMDELRQAMAHIASQAAGSDVAPGKGCFAPDVDLYDTGRVFVVRVDVPGMKPADLAVIVEDGALKIEGHRTSDGSSKETYLYSERPTGQFVRRLGLPARVAAGATKATLSDGVLEIFLPKADRRSVESVAVQVDVVGRDDRWEDRAV